MRRALFVLARILPLAGVLTLVSTGLASPQPRPTVVVASRAYPLDSGEVGPGWSTSLLTRLPTEMVGFEWSGRRAGAVEVRGRSRRGWGSWVRVEGSPAEGPDAGTPEHRNRTTAGPVWLGSKLRQVQVRVAEGSLTGLRVHAIRSEERAGPPMALRPAGAAARPGIITRAQWGADESWRRLAPGCTGQPDYDRSVRFAVVHHTDTTNAYRADQAPALVRGIYMFHTHVNGWCDIGYHFLVDRFGQVFEGRAGGMDRAVVGAHAEGFNGGSTGVALLGTFQSAAVPAAMYAALRDLLAWKLAVHGIDPAGRVTEVAGGGSRFPAGSRVGVATISAHRDLDSTDCPGDVAESLLARLRADVASGNGSTACGLLPTLDIPPVDSLLCGLKLGDRSRSPAGLRLPVLQG